MLVVSTCEDEIVSYLDVIDDKLTFCSQTIADDPSGPGLWRHVDDPRDIIMIVKSIVDEWSNIRD